MRRIPALLLILFLFTACTANDGEAIKKSDDNIIKETSAETEPEVSEIEAEEVDKYIEFNLDDEQISINISAVPILYEFLRVQQSPERAIQEFKLERLKIDNQSIFSLRFSCNNHLCSYLLFSQDQNKQAFLVADLAQFVSSFPSPDQSKIALQFNRTRDETMTLSNLVVFDLVQWKPLSIQSVEATGNLLNYTWPFLSVEWLDDESLSITIPDLMEPNKEFIDEWSTTEVSTVTFTLESE